VLAQHLKASGATHLHNHFAGPSASVAVLAADLADLRFSFTLHGPADLLAPDRWRLAEKAARASFVACISDFARSQLMLHSDPDHWDRYKIIHCGVVPARYDTPRAQPEGDAPTHLVFVGRLAAVKGLRVLMDAFSTARQTNPNLKLTIVGDGPDRAWLETAARPYGHDVHLTGFLSQSDVAQVLATADIFVLPSFAEGVPVVLMEAMASRMPVIATQVAGVPELVAHGVSGLLIPPGNAHALADAIATLATDPDRRVTMGVAGRARVTESFDIEIEARRLGTLFASVDQG
jgi:glycosyltransferase involved in cell wall biosynthesis